MSQFWQKTHLRLHMPKKMVPEPFQPCKTDSSPKWGKAELTIAFLPVLQAPFLRLRSRYTGKSTRNMFAVAVS